jgi:phosphoenolpyruvate synthase/pyruvate phosphate dikinase
VGEQIDSISLNPDAVITTTLRVAEAEKPRHAAAS